MKKVLNLTEWSNQNDDYPDKNDLSRVEIFEEDGKYFLELSCNDVSRRLQLYAPVFTRVDDTKLDKRWPVCADNDENVANVAEQLGLCLWRTPLRNDPW